MKYLLPLLLVVSTAHAEPIYRPFLAKASINNTCTLTVTDVAFGHVDVNQETLSTSTVTIRCNRGLSWNYYHAAEQIYIDGQSVAVMSNGDYRLYYQTAGDVQKMDADHFGYAGIGTGSLQEMTMPFKILRGQYVRPALYRDTVMAYVSF